MNSSELWPRLFRSLVVLVSSTTVVLAQIQTDSTPTKPVRDPAAITVVENAIAASGGPAILLVKSLQASGLIRPSDPTLPEETFVWKDLFTGTVPEFRRETTSAGSRHLLVSHHGSLDDYQELRANLYLLM